MNPYILCSALAYVLLAYYYAYSAPLLAFATVLGVGVYVCFESWKIFQRGKAKSEWLAYNGESTIHALDVDNGFYALPIHNPKRYRKRWAELQLLPNESGVGVLPEHLVHILAYTLEHNNTQSLPFLVARAIHNLRIASRYLLAKQVMDGMPHGTNKMRQTAPMPELEIYQTIQAVFAQYGQNGTDILQTYFQASAFVAGKRKVIDDVGKDYEAYQEARFQSLYLLLSEGYTIEDAMKRVENF